MLKVDIKFDDKQILKAFDDLGNHFKQHVIRPAARAGALVAYEMAKTNAPVDDGVYKNAIYHAFDKSSDSPTHKSYVVAVNMAKAPHWNFVEYGYLQRYVVRKDRGGNYWTMARPEMRGQPKPPSNASRAQKDAYYMPQPGPPQYIQPKAPMRRSFDQALPLIPDAIVKRAREKIDEFFQSQIGPRLKGDD